MKSLFITICLLSVAFSVQAQKKSEPLGVYVVTQVDDNLPAEPCWTDPNVIGVTSIKASPYVKPTGNTRFFPSTAGEQHLVGFQVRRFPYTHFTKVTSMK